MTDEIKTKIRTAERLARLEESDKNIEETLKRIETKLDINLDAIEKRCEIHGNLLVRYDQQLQQHLDAHKQQFAVLIALAGLFGGVFTKLVDWLLNR